MRKIFLILLTLIACTWGLKAQTTTYRGTVLDALNNEPLIGATIMPVGGGQGTAADIDGKFTLTVPSSVKKATVSYVGYKSQTVDLTKDMTIFLESSSTSLDEMVVVAYGTANKESLTGSVAVVGAKDIEDRPVTSVTAALEGNAPGVRVNNSVGFPGSSPEIRIRGFNSISGSNSPLYVVDGVPYDGSISDINPADIESMSVLKDAASSALYGNKGANGVVLITTKRAKSSGHVEINLSIREGVYERGLPFYDRLGANDFMQTMFTGLVNGYVSKTPGASLQDGINFYRRNFFTMAQSNVYGDELSAADLFDENGRFMPGFNPLPGYNDLDWWKIISRKGFRQEYNINAAAATEKFSVFASAGYLKENGYVLQTDFERFAGRINAEFQPVSYFKAGLNLNATYSDNSYSITSKADEGYTTNPFLVMNIAPIFPYYLHDTTTGAILRNEDGSPIWNTNSYLGNRGDNVAWSMRLDKTNSSAVVVDASLFGTVYIPYGFELTVRGNMHRDKTTSMNYMNNETGAAQGFGMLQNSTGTYKNHTFMQTLYWSHEYGNHHIDALLDHENYQFSQDVYNVSAINQLLPGIYALGNFAENQGYSQSIVSLRSESYLGRARYNYDQKYFGEVSIRRDGSSYFEKDIRWGTFWSVGGSWIISKEKFMWNLNWLNYLKLRAAYGSVGNDASAGAYAYYTLYDMLKYGNVNSLIPVSLASDNLKWEATKTFDVALEGSLFNDRFNFTVGYFNKRNSDLIFAVTRPLSGGTIADSGSNPTVLANIGTMQNIGWELQFGVDIIRNRDFQWNFSVDATFLKNKIVKLPNNQDQPGNGWFMGHSLYEMYNIDWAGVDMVTGQSLYEIDPNSPQLWYYDTDGTRKMNESQFTEYLINAASEDALYYMDGKFYTTTPAFATPKLLGTSLPTVDGSFSTNLSWKGINLGIMFTYGLGGKVYDTNYMGLMSVGTEPTALHKDVLKSWTQAPAGMPTQHEIQNVTYTSPYTTGTDGQPAYVTLPAYIVSNGEVDKNAIPQLNTDRTANNNFGSSRWLTSADYLVLKNLNLSYDLPKKWINAMKLQNINLGFSVDNLFTVTKRKGMNPQYGFNGSQGNYYVPARVFSFQLNVKF